jgi:hypothetical protein
VAIWGATHHPPTAPSPGTTTSAQTSEEWIACAQVIAEGTVESIEPAAKSGRLRVAFSVDHWIKPTSGKGEILLNVPDPQSQGKEAWRSGQRLLIVVPTNRLLAPDIFAGHRIDLYQPVIDDALPKAVGVTCPRYWRTTDGS